MQGSDMALKENLMMGAVGAAVVFAARSAAIPVVSNLVNSAGAKTTTAIPVPPVMPAKDGFGAEWALIPAAVGWYLSR